ncbi:hypothetical protein, partial [Pseudomonas protegens]|uniref:hypothetical protein n=1 Tax=Pseudomonas protegens TaxID=380021 RepID=UPI001C8340F4
MFSADKNNYWERYKIVIPNHLKQNHRQINQDISIAITRRFSTHTIKLSPSVMVDILVLLHSTRILRLMKNRYVPTKEDKHMEVSVFGTGYVGLVQAVALA